MDVVCARCGTPPRGSMLTWVLERDERGADRRLCPDCARRHLRDIESRLPDEWWV